MAVKEGSCLVNVETAEGPFHVVQCSEQFAAFFGYSVDQLLSRSLRCLNGAELSTPNFEQLIGSLEHHKYKKCKVSASKKDGSPVRPIVVLSMQTSSKDAFSNCAVLVSLCEPYEYVADDFDEIRDPNLQNTVVHDLNNQRPSKQAGRTRDHALRYDASYDAHLEDSRDREQDRDILSVMISKISCQVLDCDSLIHSFN